MGRLWGPIACGKEEGSYAGPVVEPFLRGRSRKIGFPRILSNLSGHLKEGEHVGETMEERKWEASMGS